MATVVIDLDDSAYARLKADAEARERPLEADLRLVLEDHARDLPDRDRQRAEAYWDRLRDLREHIYATHGPLPDTTALIRQMREEE